VLIAALGALIVLAPAGWPLAIVAVIGGVVVVALLAFLVSLVVQNLDELRRT
jgi:hypothetical protein